MNVLLFSRASTYNESQVGGAQTSMRLLGETLAAKGHNVYYVTRSPNEKDRVRYQKIDGVNVVFYPKFEKPSFVKSLKSRKAKRFGTTQLEALVLDLVVGNKIQIAYTYYDLWLLDRLFEVRKKSNLKIVMRMAGLMWYEESLKDEEKKKRYEIAFKGVDSVNYNTPGLKGLTYQWADKIGFNYQPQDEYVADIGAYSSVPDKPRGCSEEGALKIIVATRFSQYQKRQDLLVDAIRLLPNLNLQVLMVGSGPMQESVIQKIKEYSLDKKIKIVPFMSQPELWDNLYTADLLCHPCEYEGLSKIIIESMMLGLPVMASDVLPLTDYIERDVTGMLVKNTPEAWAEAITYLSKNKEELVGMGDRARDYALDKFDKIKNGEECEKEFLRIVSL